MELTNLIVYGTIISLFTNDCIIMQIDFYIMKSSDYVEGEMFICQLIEKAYQLAHSVLLRAEDMQTIEFFDESLWSFRSTSFIPHEISSKNELNIESASTTKKKILLNLTQQKIEDPSSFGRLLQLVPNNPNLKQKARDLYRHYLQLNFKIHTHEIPQ